MVYSSIVVGTDGSTTATRAVDKAARLARATGATVRLVTAYKPPSRSMALSPDSGLVGAQGQSQWDDEVHTDVQGMLDDLVAKLAADGVDATGHAVPKSPADALIEVAHRYEAGLIVIGNRGMQGMRRALGSVPNTVAHKAECDVLIVDTTG
jgi:nucleotide-binding universal stress UspA family protein